MVSKTKAEDDKPSEPTSSLILLSLPEDVIIDILARLSRFDYPTLSLVSKHFRSLVTSPDLYARRSLLASTEHCLYAALFDKNSCSYFHHWYILCRKSNGSHSLVPSPSKFTYFSYPGCSVAVGSRIYVFGGKCRKTNAFCMDCGSHTVQPLPSMPVPLFTKFAGFIDGKIYVIGIGRWYDDKEDVMMVVFDIETQKWEHAMIKPEMEAALRESDAHVVMADKIYIRDCYGRSCAYEPKESKWETDDRLKCIHRVKNACVVDDVLYYYYHDQGVVNTLRAYDPNHKSWGVVEGLKELLAETRYSEWSYTVRYGGNLALLFGKTSKIWCAEISLERRQGGEIWGKVEWCDHVLTGDFYVMKSLAVMV